MKKRFTFLTAAVLLLSLMVPSLAAWGGQIRTEDVVAYTLTPASGSNNSYTGNCDITISDITWNLEGNSQQIPWRLGGKSISNVNRNLYSKTAISDNITKIEVTHGTASSVTVNSWTVIVSKNSDFSSPVSTLTHSFAASATTTIYRPDGVDWSNCYYKFVYNVTISATSNKYLEFSEAKFYKEVSGGTPTTYTVTYNANDGSQNPDTYQVTDATSPHKVLNVGNGEGQINFTYAGHVFRHWRTAQDENSGTLYNAGDDMPLSDDVTLYAIWTSVHNITVNGASHGTVTGFTNPVAYGTEVTLNYTHNNGEYYSASFSSSDVTITNGTFIMPDNDVSITVTETELPKYTVTFSDSGGTLTEAHYGAGVTLPTRTGDGTYSFAGWTTSNIAAETTTAPETILTGTYYPAGNITLYPVYTRSEGEGEKWQKITNFASIDEGTYALITTTGLAFTGTINSSGHGTVTTGSFSFDNNEATSAPSGTCELTLTAVIDNDDNVLGYTMYNSDHNYLYASKAGSGGLSWHETEDDYWHITNKFSSNLWSYSKDYSGNYAFLRTYSSSGTYTFRTYSSGGNTLNGATFYFVKKVSLSTTYYISTLSSIAVPSFDPTSKNFSTENLSVTISVADGCFIKYTLDNTDPLESGTTSLSNSVTLTLTGTTTIRALTKNGDNYSAEASQTYTRVYNVTLSSNGITDTPVEVVTGESTTLAAPSNVPFGYSFRGWTGTPETPSNLVSNTYIPSANVTLYAVFGKEIYGDFKKVTSEPSNWSGYYLIVFETKNVAFNGGLVNMDVSKNTIDVSIDNSGDVATIATDDVTNASKFMFAPVTGGYSIRSASGYYIGRTANSNGLDMNATTPFVNTLSYSSGTVITSSAGPKLLCWSQGGQNPTWKISYYASNQNAIQLYKQEVRSLDGYYLQAYPSNTVATDDIKIEGTTVIESGAVLNMGTHNLINDDPANLIIEDGGQLIIPNNATVAATFRKEMPAAPAEKDDITVTGWKLISSPTNNGTTAGQAYESFASVTNLTASGYLLYNYDEENRMWRSSQTTGHTYDKLNVAQGYLYGNNTGTAIEFTGNVNSAESYSVALSYKEKDSDNLAGFNLIGNPFSHEIAWSNGVTLTGGSISNGYYKIDGEGFSATLCTENIAPLQGILVKANATGQTVTFNNVMPVAKGEQANHDNIMFKVENSEYSDVTYALFDKGYGLNKISHRGDRVPMLYIPQNGENYAIAMMDDNTNAFNLNFEAKTTGNYTLRFKSSGEFNYLHVIDRLTGEDIDMLVEGEYNFVGSPRDNANRFVVRLGYLPNYSDNGEDIFAYQNGSDIVVCGEGVLQIFDVMGRMVSSRRINGVETMCTSSLQNGVYVFRLNEKTQKIVVR